MKTGYLPGNSHIWYRPEGIIYPLRVISILSRRWNPTTPQWKVIQRYKNRTPFTPETKTLNTHIYIYIYIYIYTKCYNIICHISPHSLHFCQIIIFPSFVSIHMKSQISYFNRQGIWNFFLLQRYNIFPLKWSALPWKPFFIKYKWYWFWLVQ